VIAKITRGARARDLAAYLHGPGNKEEHVYAGRAGGAVIGGNVCLEGSRDGSTWATLLADAARVRPDITRPIWHASLRCAPGDRTLSDAEWARAAASFAQSMGFVTPPSPEPGASQPWVVVRHGEDHVHIAVSRVGFDGQVWHARQDYRQAQAACTQLEQDYGLATAPRRSTPDTQRTADHQLKAGEWRRGQRTGAAPKRVQLAERVRAAVDAAAGAGRDGFETALDRVGVGYRANTAATGRVSGYSFSLPGHVDPDGAAVWFRASQLDRGLSWSKVAPVLEAPVAAPPVQVMKKTLETRAHHERRVEQAQADARARQSAQRLEALPAVVAARVESDDRWWLQRRRGGEAAGEAIVERGRLQEWAEQARRAHEVSFPVPLSAQTKAAAKAAQKHGGRPYSPQPRDPDRGLGR